MAPTKQEFDTMLREHMQRLRASTPELLGLNALYLLEITSPWRASWSIDCRDIKTGEVVEGSVGEPDAVVRMSAETAAEIFGKASTSRAAAKQLAMDGKIECVGDTSQLVKFRRLLGGPRWSRSFANK